MKWKLKTKKHENNENREESYNKYEKNQRQGRKFLWMTEWNERKVLKTWMRGRNKADKKKSDITIRMNTLQRCWKEDGGKLITKKKLKTKEIEGTWMGKEKLSI